LVGQDNSWPLFAKVRALALISAVNLGHDALLLGGVSLRGDLMSWVLAAEVNTLMHSISAD
jgi:hypothetical protein